MGTLRKPAALALWAVALLALALPARAQGTAIPSGLRVEPAPLPQGTSALVLRWTPVPGAYGYEVFELRNGRWWTDEENPARTPMTASTTIAGLAPDTPYEFRVRAIGPAGASEMCEPVGGRTLAVGAVAKPAAGATEPSGEMPDSGPRVGPPPPLPGASPAAPAADPKTPAPPEPTGLIGIFSGNDKVQITWRNVPEAASYQVEEEKDGKWIPVPGEAGRPKENRAIVADRPVPGPYRFRVYSVGANGRRSEPSRPITVDRD